MSEIHLARLYLLQKGLDDDIAALHNVTYASTHEKRLLALLVELGEFANETRCFKFWSLKAPSAKDVILDEYADGLHFFLSLGLPLGIVSLDHELKTPAQDLTSAILAVYADVVALKENYVPSIYLKAFGDYLDILPLLGYSGEDAIAAYEKKLAVNYTRQKTHY
jgi:dimeric dUTPase (all-alpha-NTP-PPase superfamily)